MATPYLDEAERCHRVALMHLGEIHRSGTPTELRESLGMRRLEVHTDKLAEAEDKLTEAVNGAIAESGDLFPRHGDRSFTGSEIRFASSPITANCMMTAL